MPINVRDVLPGSPEWTLFRLLHRLHARQGAMKLYDDYYQGIQPLAFASDKFYEVFGGRFHAFSSNFMALVVDGTGDRLEVQGFRFKDPEGDKDLWKIWQENDLDAGSQLAHTEALVKGLAYALIEPNGTNTPRITIEDPLDCIVEPDPKDPRKRRSALKRWIDADDGHMVVYVYGPDDIFKYRSTKPWTDEFTAAVRMGMAPSMSEGTLMEGVEFDRLALPAETWPLGNPLGVVPIVALPNRPRLKMDGQSEIASVISNQDAINKYRADALVASEFAAFRQRWAIGIDIPVDPDTGQPREPFRAGVDHLWAVPPDDPNNPSSTPVSFGEFAATDLAPYKLMIDLEVQHISSITQMPYNYLLGQPQSVPASGEAIKSSEAALVAKVGKMQVHFGDGWEETMRVALRAMSDPRADIRDAETIWRDPATRNEAVVTDAVVKLWQAKILDDQDEALTLVGFSPVQIERLAKARKAREAAAAKAAALLPPPPPVVIGQLPAPGQPVVPVPPTGPRMGGSIPHA